MPHRLDKQAQRSLAGRCGRPGIGDHTREHRPRRDDRKGVGGRSWQPVAQFRQLLARWPDGHARPTGQEVVNRSAQQQFTGSIGPVHRIVRDGIAECHG
ncbi:hypothetical protein ACJBCE_00365 [Streptomyces sp. NBUL23]|uniref:hypothetical protein n=1 Tax=Streptomyces sp. NBUL23 TaxID=3381354 RepID=UPI003871A4D5